MSAGFKYLNTDNYSQMFSGSIFRLFPWAQTLEQCLNATNENDEYLHLKNKNHYDPVHYFIHRSHDGKVRMIEEEDPVNGFNFGYVIFDIPNPYLLAPNTFHRYSVPLNPLLKKYPPIEGRHSIYCHSIFAEDKILRYAGLTKQKWLSRYNQHRSDSSSGSPYVFHSALRKYHECTMVHKLLCTDLEFDTAMELEEKWVELSLYPNGLNMIPGGHAGMKYLHKLGIHAKSIKERDAAILKLSKRENINGKPNPLNAARWISDQDFINRVICSQEDRLTVEQVRLIRLYDGFGKTKDEIKSVVSPKRDHQIDNVISGKRYSKVK